jgi:hypothetical protein
MINRISFAALVWLLTVTTVVISQNKRAYFQQEVDYTIEVELDDSNHFLHAYERMVYHNHSHRPLDSIWIHLWPNAYKDNTTALAKQLRENGNLRLHYSEELERGYIDSLDFMADGNKVGWHYDEQNPDICVIRLKKPVLPGESVTLTTPFRVKIPVGKFSRLGHDGEAYQITQWYPKPAVFDMEGWHPMPYLDQGEFYSEYGSFDVRITLPSNYVVGATGDLYNPEEREWLLKKAEKTEQLAGFSLDLDFPESSKEYKTLRYRQKNVHDFAWFADKRYHVLHGEIALPGSGDTVETWVMFSNLEADLWKKAIPYVNQAVYWYSKWNGDYPYKQVTALQGALNAGGGMEYPNVTVIGENGK